MLRNVLSVLQFSQVLPYLSHFRDEHIEARSIKVICKGLHSTSEAQAPEPTPLTVSL